MNESLRQWINLVEAALRPNRPWENDSIVVFHSDRIVYHTTSEMAAKAISQHGFKTGMELGVAERRHAIFFSDKDVNPDLYARNQTGEVYAGQQAAYLTINLKGLRLLNMTYRVDGVFVNHKAYRGPSIQGTLESIPAFVAGDIDGTISFMDDGKISDVTLPKTIANKRHFGVVDKPLDEGWGTSDEHRANIVRNTEDEYRLPNLGKIVPPDQLHPMVKHGLRTITIYRGVPEGVTDIRPGDWVGLTRSYAAKHDRGGGVLSKRVPAADVAWAGTDINEYYYVPSD